jgi:hypothetical protein
MEIEARRTNLAAEVRVAPAERVDPVGLAAPAVRVASEGPVVRVELEVRVALAELVVRVELAVRVVLVEPVVRVALAVRVALVEPVVRVEPAARVALEELVAPVELAVLAASAEPVARVELAVLVLAPVAEAARTKLVTAAHHRGPVPVPRAEDSAAGAETTRELVAIGAAKAWVVVDTAAEEEAAGVAAAVE